MLHCLPWASSQRTSRSVRLNVGGHPSRAPPVPRTSFPSASSLHPSLLPLHLVGRFEGTVPVS